SLVAGRGVHVTHGREVMAGDVSREVSSPAVPARVRLGFLLQPGAHSIEGEHAVGFEREQIFRVGLLCKLRRSAGDSDVGEWNGPRAKKLVFDLSRAGTSDAGGVRRNRLSTRLVRERTERERGRGCRGGLEKVATILSGHAFQSAARSA